MIESFLKKNWRTLILVLVLLWAWFVFPTPYKFRIVEWNNSSGVDFYRVNRLNGTVEAWYGAQEVWAPFSTRSWLTNQEVRKQLNEQAGYKEDKK